MNELTDEQIDLTFNAMPDGAIGFLRTWGYQQFARAVIAADRAQRQAGQEPVAWQDRAGKPHLRYRDAVLDFEREPVPLFAAPQPAAQPAAPEGYKLVPLEPTEEMLVAGGDDLDYCLTCGYDNGPGNCGPVYTAMVEAAPL